MKIIDDQPGRVLHLEANPDGTPGLRRGCLGIVLGFSLIPAGIAAALFLSRVNSGASLEQAFEQGIAGIGMAGLMFFIGFVLVSLRQTRMIKADRQSGELELEFASMAIILQRTVRIPAMDIDQVLIKATHGGRSKKEMTIIRESGNRRVLFNVSRCDSVPEVMDLAFRLGTVMGLKYYRIERKDPENFEMRLARKVLPDGVRIPPVQKPANYRGKGRGLAIDEEPEDVIAPFRLDQHPKEVRTRVERWEPGVMVDFDEFGDWRTTFDWSIGSIRINRQGSTREIPFSEITAIELREVFLGTKSSNDAFHMKYRAGGVAGSSPKDYQFHVLARRGQDMPIMLVGGHRITTFDKGPSYRYLLSMTVDLAAALRVPYQYLESVAKADCDEAL